MVRDSGSGYGSRLTNAYVMTSTNLIVDTGPNVTIHKSDVAIFLNHERAWIPRLGRIDTGRRGDGGVGGWQVWVRWRCWQRWQWALGSRRGRRSRNRHRSACILLEKLLTSSKAFLEILVRAPAFAGWRWCARRAGDIGLRQCKLLSNQRPGSELEGSVSLSFPSRTCSRQGGA